MTGFHRRLNLRSKYSRSCNKDDIEIEDQNKRLVKMYKVIKSAFLLAVAVMAMCWGLEAQAAGDAANGEKIFQQCSACHSAEKGVNKIGPSLNGVIGRPAGSIGNYQYSQAMQEAAKKGLTWTPENVVSYLKNPHEFLDDFAGHPGAPNKMPFSLSDQKEREDVVAYLKSLAGK